MSVEYDQEARALMRLFEDFEDFNKELIDNITEIITGSSAGGVMRKRFERKVMGQRTYRDLKENTKALKAMKGERYVMKSSGELQKQTLKTMRGKAQKNKLIFSAKVPDYGKIHQEGIGKMPKREFFGFNNKNGNTQRVDVGTFNKVANEQFKKTLAKNGIKSK